MREYCPFPLSLFGENEEAVVDFRDDLEELWGHIESTVRSLDSGSIAFFRFSQRRDITAMKTTSGGRWAMRGQFDVTKSICMFLYN